MLSDMGWTRRPSEQKEQDVINTRAATKARKAAAGGAALAAAVAPMWIWPYQRKPKNSQEPH
jgi:hypothetical protein